MKPAAKIELYEQLIDGLATDHFATANNFLSPELAEGLRENALEAYRLQRMKPAGIGKDRQYQQNQSIRNDHILWLDKESSNVFERQFFKQVDELVSYLNQSCYTGIKSYEFHYAVYPDGSFFKRHLDCFQNDNSRKYSLISYLNKNWQINNGGILKAYLLNGDVKEVLPQMAASVVFRSDTIEHEVLQSNRLRISLTGWLKG